MCSESALRTPDLGPILLQKKEPGRLRPTFESGPSTLPRPSATTHPPRPSASARRVRGVARSCPRRAPRSARTGRCPGRQALGAARCARAGSAARPARPLDLIFWCAAVRVRGAPGTMPLRENGREARWGLAATALSCPWQAGAARFQRAPRLRPSCRSRPARVLVNNIIELHRPSRPAHYGFATMPVAIPASCTAGGAYGSVPTSLGPRRRPGVRERGRLLAPRARSI